MSKDLTIALQNAIGDLGTDVLKSPFLVNILESYDAFDVQDRYSEVKKKKLSEMRGKGQLEDILSWRNMTKEEILRNGQKLLKKYDGDKTVGHIINNIMLALEMPTLPKDVIPTQKQPSNIKKESITSKEWVRMTLYVITTLSVMILCAEIFNVHEWKVWDGLLILPIIGVIGTLACVILPAFLLAVGLNSLEEKKDADYDSICILLVIANVILIPVLILAWDKTCLLGALETVAYIIGFAVLILLFVFLQSAFGK